MKQDTLRKLTLATLSLCLLVFGAARAAAQGKQAIVVLRAQGGAETECGGTADISYQTIYDLKLNNEDEVRLVAGLSGNPSAAVSRKAYEDSGKSKLRDLSELKWGRDGVLYAVTLTNQGGLLAALPGDMKPQKNAEPSLSSFYSITLAGEAREGKQKRRVTLALRDVWKIYFAPEGAAVNDYLFRHAAEEKSVALWEAFLRRTNNYRAAEANSLMRDALITCARADLGRFEGGEYDALEAARTKTERAQSVRDDDVTRQLALSVRQARERVDGVRAQAEQLIKAGKWDEAIAAAEPIRVYLKTWPELNSMYDHALRQSHDLHLFKGKEALRASQLETARDECSTAWQRVSDSAEARACVCDARNNIALRDAKNFRQQHRPKEAKELTEKQLADSDCAQDPRLLADLKISKCEYSQQLLAQARQLLGVGGATSANAASASPGVRRGAGGAGTRAGARGARRGAGATTPTVISASAVVVKPINAQNKKDFREAREKLVLAAELCPEESVRSLLEAASRRLSEFCVAEGRKALQRNDDGTAYVYLQSAREYTPDDGEVHNLLGQARGRFEERTRVQVGVVARDGTRGGGTERVLNEVSAEIESAATAAGLSQPLVLDRRAAQEALGAMESGRGPSAPTVIFYAELLSASLNRSGEPRYVRSSYSYSNPDWERADREHDAVNAEYKKCVKQYGEAQCGNLHDRVMSLRAYRDRFQRNVTQEYTYRETSFVVKGNLRLSLRSLDSVARATRGGEVYEAEVDQNCVAREGVDPRDYSARDSVCTMPDDQSYLSDMINKLRSDARTHAFGQLSSLPLGYYARARTGANRQQSVEDYLRFLFLTRDKQSGEALEAQRNLLGFDPELKTDGVMR